MKSTHSLVRLIAGSATVVLLGLFPTQASANLAVYEGFDYTASSAINGTNGGTGFSNAWTSTSDITATSPGQTYSDLTVSGNKAYLNPTSANAIADRTLTNSLFASTGTVYISYLFNLASTPGERAFGIGLLDGTDNIAFIGMNSGVSTFRISGGSYNTALDTEVDITSSTTYLLVVKIDYDSSAIGQNDTVSMWVNPTLSETEPTPIASTSWNITSSVNTLRITAGYDNGTLDTSTGNIDELRIGSTWGDVVAVPEPSTAALAMSTGILVLMLGYRRRQKKA